MSVPRTVAEVIHEHVTLEVEGIDRMYLNVYQPKLQSDKAGGVFFRYHRGFSFASSALMEPISKAFIDNIEPMSNSATSRSSPSKERNAKTTSRAAYRAKFEKDEGIYLVGKAQEKDPRLSHRETHAPRHRPKVSWIVCATAMVNQYYFYGVDRDFGPFF